MKLALIGTGKMGKEIDSVVNKTEHSIVARLNSTSLNWHAMEKADVWLDFSHASSVLEHVQKAILMKKNLLIGTTGWSNQLPLIQKLLSKSDIGVLYAPNCSLGMLLFIQTLKQLKQSLKPFFSIALSGHEIHHTEKKDAPSGTALEISKQLSTNDSCPLPWSYERKPNVIGTHQVRIETPFETLTLSHQAKNRQGFAMGAIESACWLVGKTGLYTLEDYCESKIHESCRTVHSAHYSF